MYFFKIHFIPKKLMRKQPSPTPPLPFSTYPKWQLSNNHTYQGSCHCQPPVPPSLTFLLGLSSSHSCWPGYSLCLSSMQGYPLRNTIMLFKIFAAPALGLIILTPLMSGLVMSCDVPSDGRIFHLCLVKLRSDHVTCFGQWHVTFQGGNLRESSIISFHSATSLAISQIKNAPPAWVQLWWWKGAELHNGHNGWKEINLHCKPLRVWHCLWLHQSLSWWIYLYFLDLLCFML